MQNLAENIWVHEDAMTMMGAPMRLRMTVVKLASGKLWVHSPTQLQPQLKTGIEQLGEVGFIVGPNNAHNLWLKQWHEAFPSAALYVSPGTPKKLQLPETEYMVLDQLSARIWSEDFDSVYMGNTPLFHETNFLHKASRSLIVTDFIQNHNGPTPAGLAGLVTRCVFRPLGFKGLCTAPPLNMGFMVKDKLAFADYVNTLRGWDFDRIVVTHGDIIEENAKQVLLELSGKFLK